MLDSQDKIKTTLLRDKIKTTLLLPQAQLPKLKAIIVWGADASLPAAQVLLILSLMPGPSIDPPLSFLSCVCRYECARARMSGLDVKSKSKHITGTPLFSCYQRAIVSARELELVPGFELAQCFLLLKPFVATVNLNH